MKKFIIVHIPAERYHQSTFYTRVEKDFDNCKECIIPVDNIACIAEGGIVLKTGERITTKESLKTIKTFLVNEGYLRNEEESADNTDSHI